jgi:DNA (cytosine-5)-methyltransferase 1
MKISTHHTFRFADIFCGIGGFHIAAQAAAYSRGFKAECIFASDIDEEAKRAYTANFHLRPEGDITKVQADDIPDHDLLFGGFPCQAFSICGDQRGFEDARGTLFFDLARILDKKRPQAFVFENVKQLRSHDNGRTLEVIMGTLKELGYFASWRVLNALDYGVPQKRERVIIVGFRKPTIFSWPKPIACYTPLEQLLEPDDLIPPFYWASPSIQKARLEKVSGKTIPITRSIWHENKGGSIGIHPFSCAMRAGASHNYLLVDGKRRMTEREMLRLQGFPEDFKIVCSYAETRKQVGNSVAVPCIRAVIEKVIDALSSDAIVSDDQYNELLSPLQHSLPFDRILDKARVSIR